MRWIVVAVMMASSAAFGAERLALHSVEVTGEMRPGIDTELRDNFIAGLVVAGFELVPDTELQALFAKNPSLQNCKSEPCLQGVGEKLGVRWVVTATFENGDNNVTATIHLVDAKTGSLIVNDTSDCMQKYGPCPTSDKRNFVSALGHGIRNRLAPLLALDQQPAGAASVAVTAEPPVRPGSRKWFLRAGGITALVLGAAGLTVGFVEVGRDTSACGSLPTGTVCVRQRDTTNGQLFGFLTGAPLAVAGAIMTYYGFRKSRGPSVRAAVVPVSGANGAAILVDGSF